MLSNGNMTSNREALVPLNSLQTKEDLCLFKYLFHRALQW